jgi:hypothetical protein
LSGPPATTLGEMNSMKFTNNAKSLRPAAVLIAVAASLVTLLTGCANFWNLPGGTGTTATTTTLTASSSTPTVDASDTLTATVSPSAATGTVTFYSSGTSLGTGTLSSGTATYAASFATAGPFSLTATYGGDSTYAQSTSSAVSITVAAASNATLATPERAAGANREINLVLDPEATWNVMQTVHVHNLAGVVASGSTVSNIDSSSCVLYSGTVYFSGGAESQSGVYDLPGGGHLAPEEKQPDLNCGE